MSNVSILFFTDPHNSDQPPRMRKEGYRDEILKKQELLIPTAKSVDLTIIGGDIFHQKKTHKISHYLVNRIMEIYREYGVVYIVPGNHDFEMNPEEIKYNPLGIVGKLPNVKILHGGVARGVLGMDIFFKGLGEFEEEKSLEQMLQEWQVDQTERHKEMSSILYNVAVIHDAVTTQECRFSTIDFQSIKKYADLFLVGHIHNQQEFMHEFIAPGALSRGVLEADSIDREVVVVRIDIDTEERRNTAVPMKVPIRPATEVFKIEEKMHEKVLEEHVQRFLSHMYDFNPDFKQYDPEDWKKTIHNMDIPEDVREMAIRILEEL